jgi:hypothetical protein
MDQQTASVSGSAKAAVTYVGGRLDVQQVVEHYTAGRRSIVPIVIRNPFEHPISVRDIIVPTSTFVTAEPRVRRTQNGKKIADTEPKERASVRGTFLDRVVHFAVQAAAGVSFDAPELKRVSPGRTGSELNILAQEGAKIYYTVPNEQLTSINISAQENSEVHVDPVAQASSETSPPTIIPPHCEIVETFSFRAGNWLWSQPTTVNTNVQIDYEFEGMLKTQVVPITANVRPAPMAIVLGSIAGGVVGSLARGSSPFERATMFSALTAVFMSIIAAIGLSRKSGSQGVVTVEDFYGGFLVGALIGYGGPAVFEKAVNTAGTLGGSGGTH